MLKVRILAIGEDKDRWVSEAVGHYSKLLSRYIALEIVSLPSPKSSASLSPTEIRRQEAESISAKIGKGLTVMLADSGATYTSHQFAKQLEQWQTTSGGTVAFVIGGPFGLDERLLASGAPVLSLSPLTFSHQLVRLVLLEQLYRGFSILHNTEYHK